MSKAKTAEAPEKVIAHLETVFQKELDQDDQIQAAGAAIEEELISELGDHLETVPAVNLVANVLEYAVVHRATDVHFDPLETRLQVRYRIDGLLHDVLSIPKSVQQTVIARLKVLSDMDIAESRHPQDGHISVKIRDRQFDIRVASLPTNRGEKLVLRMLDSTGGVPRLEELGMDPDDRKTFEAIITRVQGMTLVTGPTGSGKTTTLYAALQRINRRSGNTITLEDPVEYQLPGINQVQINTQIQLTFASALRAAMRQDVDTILVGEVRDLDTAHIAIRAAMTGHRVFSTIHANTAPDAVNTLVNMNVPRFLIGGALNAILAQRLVRKINPEEAEDYTPDASELQRLGLNVKGKHTFRRPKAGATKGYLGRTAVYEILVLTKAVEHAILTGATIEEIEEIARSEGMRSLFEKGVDKVVSGETSAEEVFRVLSF